MQPWPLPCTCQGPSSPCSCIGFFLSLLNTHTHLTIWDSYYCSKEEVWNRLCHWPRSTNNSNKNFLGRNLDRLWSDSAVKTTQPEDECSPNSPLLQSFWSVCKMFTSPIWILTKSFLTTAHKTPVSLCRAEKIILIVWNKNVGVPPFLNHRRLICLLLPVCVVQFYSVEKGNNHPWISSTGYIRASQSNYEFMKSS